jgi:predicted nucleic acid-binding protein
MFFRDRSKNFGRSTIDFLIAQTAIDNDLYLLHNDSDFDRIKKVSPLKTWD